MFVVFVYVSFKKIWLIKIVWLVSIGSISFSWIIIVLFSVLVESIFNLHELLVCRNNIF